MNEHPLLNEQESQVLKDLLRKKGRQLLLAILVGSLFVFFAPAYQRKLYNGYNVNMTFYWVMVTIMGAVAFILLALELKDYLKLLWDLRSKRIYLYEKCISLISKSDDQTWVLTLRPSGERIEISELKIKTPQFEALQPAVGDTIRISTSFYSRKVISMEIINVRH